MKDYFKAQEPAFNINNTLPVARPGLVFIIASALIFLICVLAGWRCLSVITFFITCFVSWFFRDPERPTPPEGFGLSPADGRIIKIENLDDNPYTNGPAKKISIFMNVFNVHVNRVAIDGQLASQIYHPGTFVNADLDKASVNNERNALILNTEQGPVAMVQIAGLIARRIVSWVAEGDQLQRGQRFGMIRFGSRVDLYIPVNSEVMVTIGQKVSAGWSPIWRKPQGL